MYAYSCVPFLNYFLRINSRERYYWVKGIKVFIAFQTGCQIAFRKDFTTSIYNTPGASPDNNACIFTHLLSHAIHYRIIYEYPSCGSCRLFSFNLYSPKDNHVFFCCFNTMKKLLFPFMAPCRITTVLDCPYDRQRR